MTDTTTTGTAPTNADRQRRYRQRNVTQRNATVTQRNANVTQRNASTVTPPVTPPVTLRAVTLLCAQQGKIEIAFNDDGDAVITQKGWPDDDQIIIVSRDNIGTFIDNLTDAVGIPSFGRPA